MKLHYYTPANKGVNFGDEINSELWKYFFGNFFDDNEKVVFFGIGTILRASQKKYPDSKIILFGTGSHSPNYKLLNENLVYFVRGKLTAKALKLDNSLAITDPAVLIDELYPNNMLDSEKQYKFGYIPHYSVDNITYRKVVESLGYLYISPNAKPIDVIKMILKCKCIITEAMHGAIVSDLYRVPWIPVYTYPSFNKFKWMDWLSTVKIKVRFSKLPKLYKDESGIKSLLKIIYFKLLLKKVSYSKSHLSDSSLLTQLKSKLLAKVKEFKKDYNIDD